MRKNIKLINNLNIFIIIILLNFNLSCSKEKKKVKKFELNKDIEFKINDFENKTPQETINDDKNLFYLFSNKKDKIIYNVKSLQLLTSTYSQVLITINFNINLKIIKPEIDKKSKKLPKKEESINTFNYKIYFTNFKLEHKIIYGHVNFEAIEKKYHLLINSIYFNMKIDKYGKKIFNVENKIALNSKFKAMTGFIFNLLNNIFIEFPENLESGKNFNFIDKKYELTSEQEEDGSLKLKLSANSRKTIKQELKNNYTILKSNSANSKNKLRVLFSINDKFPIKINLLFEDKDKLEFKDEEFEYSIKNYFFIKKL